MKAIDLFAGAGGFTEGATQAGVKVLWAANHWQTAVDVHAANHPGTIHSCQDLHQADWSQVPKHDLLLASPACQGHSRARGKERPHHDVSRSTAWAVVSCLEYHRSPIAVVENVTDFRKWELFGVWKDALNKLGYSVSENILDAKYFGVPQMRERLFVVATRSKNPITLTNPGVKPIPAEKVIQWGSGNWQPVKSRDLAESTIRKIKIARERFGERFMIAYYSKDRGRSVHVPIGTVTTKDRFLIVDGDRCRMLNNEENRIAMGFPSGYQLTGNNQTDLKLLGNAVCPPVSRGLCEQIRRIA